MSHRSGARRRGVLTFPPDQYCHDLVLPIVAQSSHESAQQSPSVTGRTLVDLIWGCLATIFACAWISVHPNFIAYFQRRLKMMLITIIAPEIVVGFAARQFFAARKLSKEFNLSKTHGFFCCMGGFVSARRFPITTEKQLHESALFRDAIRKVDAEDIKDKSKGDALSKGVAVAQLLWFTTQCFARLHQRLAITELEISTLAFVAVNMVVWVLWWNKPLDVQRPIPVEPLRCCSQSTNQDPLPRFYRCFSAVAGYSTTHRYNPESSTAVPLFWSPPSASSNASQITALGITSIARQLLFSCFGDVGVLFGVIHCAAWSSHFPSAVERWMWWLSSITIAVTPPLLLLSFLHIWMGVWFPVAEGDRDEVEVDWSFVKILTSGLVVEWGAFLIYLAARLILIVLMFTTLRSVPSSVLMDINWSVYIPHLD
ncbi:hypothetical protein R3P38DRAFT_3316487 [Favolaschia claudopus]|uniref:Uncharacterized protein n=1 Tax=Favolaschia claudopus TaxID=2862362 RepID=A0AAW0BDH7_9AGAR